MLCAAPPAALTTGINPPLSVVRRNAVTANAAAPPINANNNAVPPPVTNADSRIRAVSDVAASRALKPFEYRINSVIILARPSFIPGRGTNGGICASITNRQSANAVNKAKYTYFLMLIRKRVIVGFIIDYADFKAVRQADNRDGAARKPGMNAYFIGAVGANNADFAVSHRDYTASGVDFIRLGDFRQVDFTQ